MQHLFDVDIAVKYGVDEAIFLKNIAFWINFNHANNNNFHDGRYWTYREIDAYKILFPYWTAKQVRRIIDSCVKYGLLLKGNYNKISYDRTLWYALSDEGLKLFNIKPGEREIEANPTKTPICPNGKMDFTKRENGFSQKGEPIPDKQQDIKTKERGNSLKTFCPGDKDQIISENAKSVAEQKNINVSEVVYKFQAYAKSNGWKRMDWKAAFVKWIMDERSPSIGTMTKQLVSTVKEWGKGHPDWERLYGTGS